MLTMSSYLLVGGWEENMNPKSKIENTKHVCHFGSSGLPKEVLPTLPHFVPNFRAYWSAKFLTVTHGSKKFGQREVRLERAKARAKLALARHHCAM